MKRLFYCLLFVALPFFAWAQPANVTAVSANPGDKEITISWTNSADPFGRVVVIVKQGSAVDATPTGDGTAYTANTAFGSGTAVTAGNYVVYNTNNGNPSNVTVSGLTNGVTYHIRVFVKDNGGTHVWNSGVTASAIPLPNAPINGAFSSTTCVDEGSVTFAAPATGSQYTYLVFAKPSSAITIGSPTQDAATYGAATTNMANTTPAYQNDASAILVYKGGSVPSSVDLTGLASNNGWNNFHFAIFNVDGTAYSAPLIFSGTRAASSTINNVSSLTAVAQNQSIQLSFPATLTCGDEILIVGRSGSAVTASPSGDGSAYTANATFGSGTDLDGTVVDQFAVYKGTGSSVTVTGLTNGTTYHFQAFIRKGRVWRSGSSVSDEPSAAPQITVLSPADNSTIAAGTLTNAVITFDVAVAKISGGPADNTRTARLYQVGNGTPIATIDKDNFTGFGTTTITIPFNAALTPNNQYYIQVGDNALEKSPNSTDWGGISDNTTWSFVTAATVVTPAKAASDPTANLGVCYSGNYQALTDIVIKESSVSDFSAGANQTYSIALPTGFVFNPAITTAPTISGSNISAASTLTYFNGNNAVRFSYTITGTSGTLDEIRITGLQIRYTGTTNTSGNILRIGGSAVQAGNADTDLKNHGTVVAHTIFQTTNPEFEIDELPGDPEVTPTLNVFSVTSRPVKLIGTPSGGDFTGSTPSGVSYSGTHGYIFDPGNLGVGTYPITYTVTESTGQQCRTVRTRNFFVQANFITGLLQTYCTSNSPSNISVTQTVVNNHMAARYPADPPGTYVFHEFVYWEPSTGMFTTMPPTNTLFNPADPAYQNTINIYGTIWMGYRVKRASDNSVLPDAVGGDSYFNVPYLSIRASNSPVLSFNLPSEICVNAVPLDLHTLVTPTPAAPVTDNFTGTATTNLGSNQWRFTPSNVPGANSNSQVVELTYNYRDPGTTCTNSIKKSVTVYPVPTAMNAGMLSPGTNISVCQDGTPGSFSANVVAGTKYNWYDTNPPSGPAIITGNTFSPPVNTSSPGSVPFSVTRIINGCESPALALTVTINATPSAPGSSFDRQYCVEEVIPNGDFAVSGSNLKWIDAITSQSITVANPNQPTTGELGISNVDANKYSFIVTQSIAGCESPPISVTAVINELPKIFIGASADLMNICKTAPQPVNLTGTPADGNWSGSAGIALINTNQAAGTTQLNPGALNSDPGNYNLTYSYTDGNGCANNSTVDIHILPTIIPNITFGRTCEDVPVDFTNSSTVVPAGGATIASTSWSFGDGLGLRPGDGIIPTDEATASRSTGTYLSPSHIYETVGSFQYSATMVTSDGCVVTIPVSTLTVNPNPIATFTWQNICADPVNGSSTQFNGSTTNGVAIASYVWDFSVNNTLTEGNAPTGQTPVVNYTNLGKDIARLTVTSTANCVDDIEKQIYIVPAYPAINESNSYTRDFNSGDENWVTGGTNSSWQHGTPAGTIINADASGDGQAWVTNLTGNSNAGEQSWVLTPCFDFTEAIKPVLAMDIWSATPKGLDGAVLQYNENGNIENDANWVVVGNLTSGLNWYDQQGISSKPGNQASGDVGWTGDNTGNKYTGWIRAVYKLDNLIGKSNIVFRVAFGSVQGSSEGFAFDNVYVGERTRTVLVESFTNSSAAAGSGAHNDFFHEFEETSTEVVKIQYHTSFPGDDPIHNLNTSINDARTSFYGISSSPTMRIDGDFGLGATSEWVPDVYDERVLNPSPIGIVFNSVQLNGDDVKINISIQNKTGQALPMQDAHVFVAILEKKIVGSQFLGSSGNDEFIYVAKDFLPSSAGTKINQDIPANASFIVPEITWSNQRLIDPTQAVIAVFVQSSVGNKEVYQAKLFNTTPPVPALVTGIDHLLIEMVELYPNPSNEVLNVILPQPVQNETPVTMFDSFGRVVSQSVLERGESRKQIITKEMSGGMYFIQLQIDTHLVRRKILILHK